MYAIYGSNIPVYVTDPLAKKVKEIKGGGGGGGDEWKNKAHMQPMYAIYLFVTNPEKGQKRYIHEKKMNV